MFRESKKKLLESEQKNKSMDRILRHLLHDFSGGLIGIESLLSMHERADSRMKKDIYPDIILTINHLKMMTRALSEYYFDRFDKETEYCELPILLYYLVTFEEELSFRISQALDIKQLLQTRRLYIAMGLDEFKACILAILRQLEFIYREDARHFHDITVKILMEHEIAKIRFEGPATSRDAAEARKSHEASSQAMATCQSILERRKSAIWTDIQGDAVVIMLTVPLLKIK